jgi:DNA-binding IclR family transcriptional regulator
MPADTIISMLENGKWHNLKDIPQETKLNPSKIEHVTKFLEQYNFVKINQTTQKIKLNPPMSKFLKKIRQLETEKNK